jgi:hypothetical protein
MFRWFYSLIFWMAVVAWPLIDQNRLDDPLVWIALVINISVLFFVRSRTETEELGLIRGFDLIAGSCMSGCANITILYLPLLMLSIYALILIRSVLSLVWGREYSQERWTGLVESFVRNRINAPLNPMTHLAPPDPHTLEINPDDPDGLLEAASHFEMAGEWDRAKALYAMAAEKLKGRQDGVYAENCIKRIQEKMERSQGL